VQRLLNDVVLTTENFEATRELASRQERLALTLQSEGAPLRKENSRLIRENNEVRQACRRRCDGRACSGC
jgi:hypothetical protein